jgi:nitrogen regulatory protein P-II 1
MKLVVAIIRPERLSAVLESLYRADVRGLTVSKVQGHGGETEHVETYRGTTVKVDLSPKVRLEIGVSEAFVQPTIDAIVAGARTGDVGDGKIFVMPVEQVVRIRTGDRNEAAVTPEPTAEA